LTAIASLPAAILLAATPATPVTPAPPPAHRQVLPADASARLVGAALEGHAYDRLVELADTVGPRLAGSPGAAAAVNWAARRLRDDGFQVKLEPVRVPHWVRGVERAEVVGVGAAGSMPLAVTALGGSPGTPAGGVEGEVLEVKSLDELRALGARAKGKIVLFQHEMDSGKTGYGEASPLRGRGPAEAAKAGAVAALVRSLATSSLRSPHTGTTSFPAGGPRLPAAAIATEDADLLHRLAARGPVKVKLLLGCGPGSPPEVESANVVAEIHGRERPDEIVVIGAHLDSWDLAQGAVDDGAGVAMVMETLRIARALRIAPRRTLRAVLFMNEEHGLSGGVAYAEQHRAELSRHVAALEADSGAGRPVAAGTNAGPAGEALLRRLIAPLAGLGVTSVVSVRGGGADISPLAYERVPHAAVRQDTARYFDVHHSAADTVDKVDRAELAQATAAFAILAFGLAESEEALPRPEAPKEEPWWK
jgi:hypothetical protein